jgi:hypothetical protein
VEAALTIPEGFEPVELAGDWPPGLPSGVFACREVDGELIIDQADPRIVISAPIVDSVASGRARPEVTLSRVDFTFPNGHVGALLKIRAANRHVVYRLTEWLPSIRAYVGEWPE